MEPLGPEDGDQPRRVRPGTLFSHSFPPNTATLTPVRFSYLSLHGGREHPFEGQRDEIQKS